MASVRLLSHQPLVPLCRSILFKLRHGEQLPFVCFSSRRVRLWGGCFLVLPPSVLDSGCLEQSPPLSAFVVTWRAELRRLQTHKPFRLRLQTKCFLMHKWLEEYNVFFS